MIIVGEYWTSADIVDCIVSYTVTQLMDIMTDANSRDGAEMLARVSPSSTPCICSMHCQFLHVHLHSCSCVIITNVVALPRKLLQHMPVLHLAVRRATDVLTQPPGADR